jgi:5-methylcytosine-specific restriction endonuclease McrA
MKKISDKRRAKLKEKSEETRKLHIFMKEWFDKQNPKVCWSCGQRLYEFSTAYVDHLLKKSKYPQFSMDEDNLFLCCLICHDSKENGHPKPKHKEAILNIEKVKGI